MKKLFLILFLAVLLVGSVSAETFTFDNVLSYKNNDLKVTIINTFGLGKELGTIELKSHSSVDEIRKVGAGNQVVMWYDFERWEFYKNGLGDVEFVDMNTGKEINRDYSFVYWGEKERNIYGQGKCSLSINGTQVCETIIIGKETYNDWLPLNSKDIPKGNIRIGLMTYVEVGDTIDGVWTIAGKKIKRHAEWTAELNVDLFEYFKFDEQDTTGLGNIIGELGRANGTNHGADNSSGVINTAYDYVRTNTDYILINESVQSAFTDDFTVSLGIKVDDNATDENYLDTRYDADTKGILIWRYQTHINVIFRLPSGNKQLTTTTAIIDDGEWHQIVVRRKGINLDVWYDGSFVLAVAGSNDDISHTNPMYIGSKIGAETSTDGKIDEIGVWNRSLSDEEIVQIWNGGNFISYIFVDAYPVVTLNSPIDTYNTTNSIITFNATVSDDIDLVNVSFILNNTYNSTNSSGFNALNYINTLTLADGYYNWTYEACDNASQCTNATVRTFTILPFIEEETFYNPYTYETSQETFTINITTKGTQATSAEFFYNGVSQGAATKTGTDANANFSNTIQIPTGVGNKTFFWQLTIGATKVNTTAINQTVSMTQFGLCNATLTVPYINFTFKDEETSSNINATIDTSTWSYWLGDGTYKKELLFSNTTENPSYAFCLIPGNVTMHNTRSVQYASPGYPQRKYDASSDLTNTTLNQTLYLLSSADGIYSTIHVVDQAVTNVVGIEVTAERQFAGVWTVVGQEETDAAGSVTFWVNPDYDHRFTFIGDDCEGTITTIRPTQTLYTQQLQCGVAEEVEYISPYKGIKYSISPKPGTWLSEDTVYVFTFNITANLSNLIFYSLNITDKDGTQLNSTYGTTSTGGNLIILLDTTDYRKLYGYYYIDIGNGTILLDPALWIVRDIEAGRGSIKTFFINLVGSEVDIEDNYNNLMLIFFILFTAMAAFCYSTGMEMSQPGINLFIIFFFVAILSLAGYFTIDFAPSDFVNKYGILLVVFFLAGGYTLGQWART